MARVIINGKPGEIWTNNTKTNWWQLHCSLKDTCGSWFQNHLAVAEYWAAPFHRGCECRRKMIAPGQSAVPFVDFFQLLRGMDTSQHNAAVGIANWILIESKVVS